MKTKKQCSVIVYGDIGRSPRMQNHAYELLTNTSYQVNLFGYLENPMRNDLNIQKNLNFIDINLSVVRKLKQLPKIFYLLYAVLRIAIESLYLLYILLIDMRYQEFILVQNPPSIPVLAVCYMVKLLRGSKLVIDFHNYGYTILGLNIKNPIILYLAKFYEIFFGRLADISFCVSKAMQQDLQQSWGMKNRYKNILLPQVLYDKANTQIFGPFANLEDKHNFFIKMNLRWENEMPPSNQTLFTRYNSSGQIIEQADRPVLIVSSTSWTKDEDFDLFFLALKQYEFYARKYESYSQYLPRLFVAITGKGPEKERFAQIIKDEQSEWKYIRIVQLWLHSEDYPKLLAASDLGVCLHYSSSGVDLPMKVVDMFGAGIPVLAKRYQAIGELVKYNQNGILFDTHEDLFDAILLLFKNFPDDIELLSHMKERVQKFRNDTFHDEWIKNALPLLWK